MSDRVLYPIREKIRAASASDINVSGLRPRVRSATEVKKEKRGFTAAWLKT